MALLDSAMGHAVTHAVQGEGRFNAPAQINTNFLAPVQQGVLWAESRVLKIGKRLTVVEPQGHDSAGTLMAIATATDGLLP